MIAGAAYLASASASLVVPALAPLVHQVTMPLTLGELPIVVWLLIGKPRATGDAAR